MSGISVALLVMYMWAHGQTIYATRAWQARDAPYVVHEACESATLCDSLVAEAEDEMYAGTPPEPRPRFYKPRFWNMAEMREHNLAEPQDVPAVQGPSGADFSHIPLHMTLAGDLHCLEVRQYVDGTVAIYGSRSFTGCGGKQAVLIYGQTELPRSRRGERR